MRHCICLFSLLLFSCSVAEPTAKQAMIEISFFVNQQSLKRGLVILESKLTNHTDDLTFLSWNTPFDHSLTGNFLRVVEMVDDGAEKELAYTGRMVKRRAPTELDYITVLGGKTLKNQLDITKSYTFCQNRRYIISLAGDMFTPDYQTIAVGVASVDFKTGELFPECEE